MGQVRSETKQQDRKVRLARIPAFPPIVLRLLNLLSNQDVEIRDLVSLVSSDPAFSAQLLRVANSPLFGFSAQIDSLQSALVVLGLRRVRALTMTVATSNHMRAVLKIEELSRCWRHMLACAVLTEELARSCSVFLDRAYSAGLLHDVGRLGLLLAYPEEYAAILRDADHNALDLLDCEKESLGMDHCEAGRILAATWNLPGDFQIVAARHHDSQEDCRLDLLTLVHLGCRLADVLGYWVVKPLQPKTLDQFHSSLPSLLQGRIHIDEPRWRELLDRRVKCFIEAGEDLPAPQWEREDSLEVTEDAEGAGEKPILVPALPRPRERDYLEILAIGMLIASFAVAAVYFAVIP